MESNHDNIDYQKLADIIINDESFLTILIRAMSSNPSIMSKIRGPQGPQGKSGEMSKINSHCEYSHDIESARLNAIQVSSQYESQYDSNEKDRKLARLKVIQEIKDEMRKRYPSIKFKSDNLQNL